MRAGNLPSNWEVELPHDAFMAVVRGMVSGGSILHSPMSHMAMTRVQIDYGLIADLYAEDLSDVAIAAMAQCSETTVSKWRQTKGLPLGTVQLWRRNGRSRA